MSSFTALEADDFDVRYRADPDPWAYESSPYELAKYERTLAAVPPGPIGRALELGCSNGAFTARLAPRCEILIAIDFSAEAVGLASARAGELAGVRIERRDLRDGLPAGRFDLIVCSEVLYYLGRGEVERFCERLPAALSPAGRLVAVHWCGEDPRAPLDGGEVHRALREHLDGILLRTEDVRVFDDSDPGREYLLGRWERRRDQ